MGVADQVYLWLGLGWQVVLFHGANDAHHFLHQLHPRVQSWVVVFQLRGDKIAREREIVCVCVWVLGVVR